MPIDKYKRYQTNLSMGEMFPNKKKGICACGCGEKLTGRRRRWATDECVKPLLVEYGIIKGDTQIIRHELKKRDNINNRVYCAKCKKDVTWEAWDADHIIEVRHGGGGCGLENYQILCLECHKRKTKINHKKKVRKKYKRKK